MSIQLVPTKAEVDSFMSNLYEGLFLEHQEDSCNLGCVFCEAEATKAVDIGYRDSLDALDKLIEDHLCSHREALPECGYCRIELDGEYEVEEGDY